MYWGREWRAVLLIVGIFLLTFYLPIEPFESAVPLIGPVWEAFYLARWYAREHVLLCLVPAFFIAGAISVFISQDAVMKYLGARASKILAYGVASVSGSVLAVCSCTVLPLFAGIYKRGAGLGPATAFLYAGPAINVLAIILTARVLGMELGIARGVGAVVFSIVLGACMHLLFRREELEKARVEAALPEPTVERPLWQNGLYFGALVAILVFANWGSPGESGSVWRTIASGKWALTAGFAVGLGVMLVRWFGTVWWRVGVAALVVGTLALGFPATPTVSFTAGALGLTVIAGSQEGEMREWLRESWGFAKQILPLLLLGVLIAGALLGRPDHEGLIPSVWVGTAVGGNSLVANFFASVAGAFMYFATLTEVPILQGLIGNGMGKGPALALLLAGPALSLPNMLVIRSVMGTKKTVAFVTLAVTMATMTGMLYGTFFG
jgi:uncharacterized membrane protein YraQ (UPF0718 family)